MKLRKPVCIVLFFVGLTLFIFSLMSFFRNATDLFWVMTISAVAAMVLGMFGVLYRPRETERLNSKYARKSELVTKPEREFLSTLRQISPEKYEVVPQVALVNVIDKKTNTQYRNELFRVCDYCFVDRKTFRPLLLVELNDSSHNRPERRERDRKVAAICESAGLPLVTFWMTNDLSLPTVKKAVMRAILK